MNLKSILSLTVLALIHTICIPVFCMDKEPEPFKLGFEFQESNHLFNQKDEQNPETLSDDFVKVPLFSFQHKGRKIFHIEADDLDLEIVTAPFCSHDKDFFVQSLSILQSFVNRLYSFLRESKQNKINLLDLFLFVEKSIKNKEFFTTDDIKSYEKNFEIDSFKDLSINLEKEENVLKKIQILKYGNFNPSFKPQFSIQTDLSNFLSYYFFLFYNDSGNIFDAPMLAFKKVFFDKKIKEPEVIDPVKNFISLYLYTCISPEIVTDIEGMGSGMTQLMIKSEQCDYKIYLPVMSRISFSDLSYYLGDWKKIMNDEWPKITSQKCFFVGEYDFGDFYNPEITKNLTKYIKKDTHNSEQNLFKNALNKGIVTTKILEQLEKEAFFDKEQQKEVISYIENYGSHIYNSVGEGKNKGIEISFIEEGSKILVKGKDTTSDLFSPPFLSQAGNSMGTFPSKNLDNKYGGFLFEVRAANKLGKHLKTKLKNYSSNINTRDFLQYPNNIYEDSLALLHILNIKTNSKDLSALIEKTIGGFK